METGSPVEVPQSLKLREEKITLRCGFERKQLSLVLAGKMNPHDATIRSVVYVNFEY
jgi:hypothetical protein